MKFICRLTLLLILSISTQLSAATWYVYYNGNGNGTAWNNSLSTIQAAINAASSGDDILVAYGSDNQSYTYSISSHLEIDNKNLRITSAKYDDGDTYASAAYDSSKVIISASGTNRLFYIHGSGVTNMTEIRGFKLTNGNASNHNNMGGAVYCGVEADPTISNCWITGNVAATSGEGKGGGIGSADVSPVISNNLIENNTARSGSDYSQGKGGGIWVQGGSATISNNTIKNNIGRDGSEGNGYGGGIGFNNLSAAATISGNTISNNTAGTNISDHTCYGGGISIVSNGSYTISDNNIENNVASTGPGEGYGGGLHIDGGSGDITVTDNTFYDNTVSSNAAANKPNHQGGGLYSYRGSVSVKNNIFNYNTVLSNSADASNTAMGGGIYFHSSATIENNTFYANADVSFSNTGGVGSGFYCYYAPSSFKNNLFVNHATSVRANSDGKAIATSDQGQFTVSYCGFYNNDTNIGDYALTGSNNITSNPQFIDAGNADFTLLYNSPCIEAGNGNYTYSESDNHDYGWKYDLGAEEYAGSRAAVTVSGSGTVFFGGKVRAKVNVTTQGTLSALDITVHENETHTNAPNSVKRWYSITATGSGATTDLTLSYKDSELNGETESALKFYRRNSSSWEGPKSFSASSTEDNWATCSGQISFSDWIITDTENEQSLPVNLAHFEANAKTGGVQLSWITSSEIDNLGFIIERKTNRSAWERLASFNDTDALKGQGSVTSETNYTYLDQAIDPDRLYSYRLIDVNYQGKQKVHTEWEISVKSQKAGHQLPEKFRLVQIYPNPFNPSTTIAYNLAETFITNLIIFDVLGRPVRTLQQGIQVGGYYEKLWDGRNDDGLLLNAGIYFCTLTVDQNVFRQKLVLLK